MRRRRRILATFAALMLGPARAQGSARWVLGQSLPLSGPGFPMANRTLAGARAMVERQNQAGGVAGRPLELLTLDDGGDPRRTAANVRALAQRGALAVVNSLGEGASLAAAQAARTAGLPLVGPQSGASALRETGPGAVFTLQPDDAREAQAMLKQLQAIGIAQLAHLVDGHEPQRERVLAEVLAQGGVAVRRLPLPAAAALPAVLKDAAAAAPQALLLSLGPEALDALGRVDAAALEGLPPVVLSLSGPGLTQLTRLLRSRTLGFTAVVPHPEVSQLPLVREFERDVETLGSPEAISFEGLAAYLATRLCVEALRRLGPRADAAAMTQALEGLGRLSLGGFLLAYSPGRHHGSDFVEVGLRTRDGRIRR